MAEEVKGFAEHLAGFKRHWKLGVAVFSVILVGGVGLAVSLPDVYRSSGYILIQQAEIPEEIVRSTVITSTTEGVTRLNERILTINNLVRLIEQFDLYPQERANNVPAELLAFQARNAIGVQIETRETVTAQGIPRPIAVGFTVSFEDGNPRKAQAVAAELVDLYLAENRRVRAEQTTETSDFLKGEVSRLESELSDVESELARFKEDNANSLPSLSAVNMNQMARLDAQLLEIQRRLNVNEDTRLSIQAQLATVDPTLPSRLPDGSVYLSPQDQLKSLQTQLSVYLSRYSSDHPDVLRTQRDIRSLQERYGLSVNLAQLEQSLSNARAELAVAEERYSEDHPDVIRLQRTVEELQKQIVDGAARQLDASVTPDNPAYISLMTSLDRLRADEAALIAERAELERRMSDYEQRLGLAPQLEKELAALSRKVSSTANRYWVMRDRQFAAEMGETLETQTKGERLVLVEPPRVPLRPFKPDRGAIIALAFLFGLVAGLAVTQLADALDRSIRGPAAIETVQGTPPLVEIPYIYNREEIERSRRLRKLGFAAAPVVAAGIAIIVHFTVMPLNVLVLTAAQRLGL